MQLSQLTIRNFGPFRNATLGPLQHLNVLIGPNGSGKSTVFRVFETMRTCLSRGAGAAFAPHGFEAVRQLGSDEPICFEFVFDDGHHYEVSFAAEPSGPVVQHEELAGYFEYSRGSGQALTNELQRGNPDAEAEYDAFDTGRSDELALGALGRLASKYPTAARLRRFFDDWFGFQPENGSHSSPLRDSRVAALGENAGNLPGVLRHLHDNDAAAWTSILELLHRYVPELEDIIVRQTDDGRVLLDFRDAPFEGVFPAALASDGTRLLLAHATLLASDLKPSILGLEEPERAIHHAALQEFIERYRAFAQGRDCRVIVTTQAPELLNALEPNEVFVVSKEHGEATIRCAADDANVVSLHEAGDPLGALFRQNLLRGANP